MGIFVFQSIVPYIEKFPKLSAWRERARAKIPGYTDITKEGIAEFTQLVASKVKEA